MCYNCQTLLTFIYSFFDYPLDKLKPLHYGQSDETCHLYSRCQTSTSQKSSAFWKRDFGIRHDKNHITMKVLILTRYKFKPGWAIKLNHNLEDWHIQLSIYEKWTIQGLLIPCALKFTWQTQTFTIHAIRWEMSPQLSIFFKPAQRCLLEKRLSNLPCKKT